MTEIYSVDVDAWQPQLAIDVAERAIQVIEAGGVIFLPQLGFKVDPSEERFLSPRWLNGTRKNIGLDGDAVGGAAGSPAELSALASMISRFARSAATLIRAFFPRYAPYLERARTSFRPAAVVHRQESYRKDDSRLHVDAFPSRPNQGERILRVFTNIDPGGNDRVWRIGEPFEAMARRFLPAITRPLPGSSSLLQWLRITKTRRSEYDHIMLQLHDRAKADLAYQRDSPQREVHFPAGSTWLCFSDQLSHAAMSGQFMLEQTLHLPIAALYDRDSSPLAILERLRGRQLTASLR